MPDNKKVKRRIIKKDETEADEDEEVAAGGDDDEEEEILLDDSSSVDEDVDEDEADDIDEMKQKTTTGRKRGRPTKSNELKKKKQKTNKKSSSSKKQLKLLEEAKRDAKIEFEKYREEILNNIPKSYRAMFGRIGFTKWQKSFVPCLVLSPFDVPPGGVRKMWLDMYEKKNKQNSINTMSYLIYWYGATDEQNMYGFIAKNAFTPYEKETEKSAGAHILPVKIQKKLDNKSKLNKADQDLFNAYTEMEEDLKLSPTERKRGIVDFPEGYNLLELKDIEDGEENDDESESSDEDAELSDASSVAKEANDESEEQVITPIKAESEAKSLGKNKKKTTPSETKDMDRTKNKTKPNASEVKQDPDGELRKTNVDIEEIGDAEEDSDVEESADRSKKTKDNKPGRKKNMEETDDNKQESKIKNTKNENKVKKKEINTDKVSAPENDKNEETVRASEKTECTGKNEKREEASHQESKTGNGIKSPVAVSKKKRHSAIFDKTENNTNVEQRLFQECEHSYLAEIEAWKNSLESNDVERLKQAITELFKVAANFSAPFIQAYEILSLIKQTENVAAQHGIFAFKLLKANLFTTLAEKKQRVPKGFIPIKGLGPPAPVEEEVESDEQDDNIQPDEDEEQEKQLISEKKGDVVHKEAPKKEKKAQVKKVAKAKKRRKVVDDSNEEESGEDERDADFSADDDISSDNGERDANYEEAEKTVRERKKASSNQKESVTKVTKPVKHKIDKAMSKRGLILKEHHAFKVCERKFLPLIDKWKSSLKERNVKGTIDILDDISSVVEEFSASFTEYYKLSDLLKGTKQLFKEEKEDLSSLTALREKFKECYIRKVALVPKEFVPKKPEKLEAKEVGTQIESKGDINGLKTIISQKSSGIMRDVKTEYIPKSPSKNLLENVAPKVVSTQIETKTDAKRPALVKPERKKFSLTSLMRPTTLKEPEHRENITSSIVKNQSTSKVKSERQAVDALPSWVKDPPVMDEPKNDPRLFAMEFLLQMALQFPEGKVNVDSVARSLEAAIFDWANEGTDDDAWTQKYWSRIHAIVAAVCGKRDHGTLMNLIMRGQFDSPETIVQLSEDDLIASFEGRPLNL